MSPSVRVNRTVIPLRKDHLLLSELLSQFDWLVHGFGTRAFADPPEVHTLKQVHSNRVAQIRDYFPGMQADGLVTDIPGALAGVQTADCVPILLVDPRRRVAAAVHAGWRGSAAGILAEAIRVMRDQNSVEVEDIRMAIGPSIGPCCYEVGDEVVSRFREIFPEQVWTGGRRMLDLKEANRRQAVAAGVPAAQIDVIPLCTRCLPEDFHSFRRDKDACGRLLSFIGIRP